MSDRRTCTAAARLIRVWMAVPHAPFYAAELGETAELPAGVLYPLLARLERARWITGFWEPADPMEPYRPARRYYRLTVDGHECAQAAFEDAGLELAPPPKTVRPNTESPDTRSPDDAQPPNTEPPKIAPPGDAQPPNTDPPNTDPTTDPPNTAPTRRGSASRVAAAALLGAARLRLSGRARQHIAEEWVAELGFVIARGGPAVQFAAGLFAAAPRVHAGAAVRVAPDPAPCGVRRARRRLKSARRAWSAAARQHALIDSDADPVGETIALHAALYCQFEVDDAQLAYGAACVIAALERGAFTR